jgi:hypothetical protein
MLVLLGAPWSLSWREVLVIKKDRPFKLTYDLLGKEINDKFKSLHPGLQIISSHAMSVHVNGYKIEDPIGKVTPSVECDVYMESAPEEFLLSISKVLEKHLPHGQHRFSTLTFAGAEALAKYSGEKNFIFILPEANSTEIVLWKDGSIRSGASLPVGSETIARAVSQNNANDGVRESIHLTHRFISGKVTDEAKEKIEAILKQEKEKFIGNFRNAIFSMNDSVLCPNIVFVGGKSIAGHFLSDWLSKEEYASETFTGDCFRVKNLAGADIVPKEFYLGKTLPFAAAISSVAAASFAKTSKPEEKTFEIELNKIK